MRILGINLQTPQEASWAEAFLRFSSRVQFRPPHFIFCDIESTAHLFGGEFKLLEEALRTARSLAQQAPTAAIADSPVFAQVFAVFRPSLITTPGEDRKSFSILPLNALLEMEGLQAWADRSQVQHIIEFLNHLGLQSLDEVLQLSSNFFQEPWGLLGLEIWNRLHEKETQFISAHKNSAEDRWQKLIQFADQAHCKMGLLEIKDSHFPEKSFHIKTDCSSDFSSAAFVDKSEENVQNNSLLKKSLGKNPRPSLILKEALPISKPMLKNLKLFSQIPSERIESSWWEFSNELHKSRDYYFASSEEGQLLWVYQDRNSKHYYLQGYFD